MKKYLFAAAALAALFSVNVLAEMDEAQHEAFAAECKTNAMEEGISDEEMESYIAKCVQDLAASESEGEAKESEESEDETDSD
jgi:hypothetical protein